ncbi:ornithine carbamoyltransferase [Atractiella rhizophila]|nr:ornithine carbamoyltransferase [Atractiella rhizophila]
MMVRPSLARTFSTTHRILRPHSIPPFVPPTPFPRDLLTLADLTVPQIQSLIVTAVNYKKKFGAGTHVSTSLLGPTQDKALDGKTISLLFSKRSTRTRVASESATALLGGHAMFLGASDIQLGENETLPDTSVVISSMTDGIMARVGDHSEILTISKHSSKPVVNALSSLYHPTQILADLQTLLETLGPFSPYLASLSGRTVAWIGDANNILNEMLVTLPRLGINLNVATPKGYEVDGQVIGTMEHGMTEDGAGKGNVLFTHSPEQAVRGADVVVTDTWISMGQETEKEQRLKDFAGYQVTEELCQAGGAKHDWKFMHCLPRKPNEVDDAVFYGKRSLVFQEAENRKWTIMDDLTRVAVYDRAYSVTSSVHESKCAH